MSGQNTSSAVMQQRKANLGKIDDFPTPMWATRVLVEYLIHKMGHDIANQIAKEPCANRGYMAIPLADEFAMVLASDIIDYGVGYTVEDYLFGDPTEIVDWTIANPPFKFAEQFIERALKTSRVGVAMFVRSAFTESEGRYERLFKHNPPTRVLQFSERVIIHGGIVRDPREKYFDAEANEGEGKWKTPSSATSYCWLIWDQSRVVGTDQEFTEFVFLPPCRKRLERPGDYDVLGSVVT